MFDVIVIGAGPAGLQAALTLGRMHRKTLMLDSGEYRNGAVAHMHNVIANDGTSPAVFRSTALEQLSAYPDVEVRVDAATTISGAADGFTVTLADGRAEQATRIILATGIADDLPDVPGLAEVWGRFAFTCPFCDGHEFSGKSIGVLGATARTEHLLSLLERIVGSITVFPVGEEPSEADRHALEVRGARVHAPIESVRPHEDGVIVGAGGVDEPLAGLFVAAVSVRQRAPFAEQLGVRMLESGAIEIDEFGRTSVPGVSAAGDLAHRATLPGAVASVVMAAAAGQMAAAGIVQELSTEAD